MNPHLDKTKYYYGKIAQVNESQCVATIDLERGGETADVILHTMYTPDTDKLPVPGEDLILVFLSGWHAGIPVGQGYLHRQGERPKGLDWQGAKKLSWPVDWSPTKHPRG